MLCSHVQPDSLNWLIPWAQTGQAEKGSTNTNPPYVVSNDLRIVGVRIGLSTRSVGQGPVALQLLCFYFPPYSPLHGWNLQPGSWGCCCRDTPLGCGSSARMHFLPPILPLVPQPSTGAKEHAYGLGILGFSKPPALNTFLLIRVVEAIAFSRLRVGPGALILLHIDILQGSAWNQQLEGAVEPCPRTISSHFYKTAGIQNPALNVSFKQALTLKCVLFDAQETCTNIYSDNRNLLVFQTLQEKHWALYSK